jgi:two-component system CheB/CheR fusion protein
MFVVRKELRPAVIFGRHDLVQDAPISRIDLLMCRNTLMYLNSETQSRVMEHFYFALAEGGFLVLGKAEMLFTQLKSFLPVDLKRRVFVKNTVDDEARERLLLMSNAGREEGGSISNHVRGRESAFEHGPVAQIVLDRNGIVVQANERARRLFNISVQDVGRPLQDLDLSFRPVELRSHLKVLQKDRKSVRVRDVRWQLEGNSIWLEIELVALEDTGGRLLGTSIAFHEVTRYRELQEELDQSNQELETAIEELQSTNEELETTNEELQSTNEELETMNEELHSTNDELQTINDEARRRSEELNRANAFLGGILGSVNAAVVVLDQDLRVLLWNDRSRDLWGLTADEVAGQPFLHLDIGLPVERLRDSLLGGANGDGQDPIDLEAVNRRGQRILCRVRFSPMRDTHGVQSGMILTMEDAPPDGG